MTMKRGMKILLIWLAAVVTMTAILLLEGRQGPGQSAFVVQSLQILIAIIALWLTFVEPNRKNRFLFFNFVVFFFLSFVIFAAGALDTVMSRIDQYLPFVVAQYTKGIYYAVLAFAIVYLVLDSLFRELKVAYKYLASVAIVGAFFFSYFQDFIADPKHAYRSADVEDFRAVDKVYASLNASEGREPSPEEIAAALSLPAWNENQRIGNLYAETNLERIREIYNYLPGDNYNVLLYKPIYLYVIKMNVLCCFFIMLFFGYQYKKDPPQGAYVDKIVFLLLLFCSMEIFHAWSFIHTVEWEEFVEIFVIGQYITIFILIVIAALFALRLRFVTSAAGEFYENELVHSAQHITRWRDWIDNFVLHHFLNPKTIRGAFFSQRNKE